MAKRFAVVDEVSCVSCGACVNVCPRGAIEIVKGCHASVNVNLCVGCGLCARTCPAGVIEVMTHEG
ncbi:MAG: 4Fe-4S binding protein [Synergistaceae bacterium]|nr:4Fe-4S binding protein [Synergistaceae bacterium]MBQ7169955.1 4Fe-4S binding protein [Synergistaceae bacterium]MBR0034087.1 4Fe-4S binding protein [Synergistaceae bacterium]